MCVPQWLFDVFIDSGHSEKRKHVSVLGDRTTSVLVSIIDPEEFSMPKIRYKTLDICV